MSLESSVPYNLTLTYTIINDYWSFHKNYINLIASSCYPFKEVMRIQSTPMQTLPIEGLPGYRFFPAYNCMDDLENYAEALILRLFHAASDYAASIQPHSGTQANQIVYNAVLQDNDVVLSMGTSEGGHISHTKVAGKKVKIVHYGLTNEGYINYKQIESLALENNPRLIIAGASSYSRKIDYHRLREIADMIGAQLMADICHTALFILVGMHPNVCPFADFITFTMDKNLRGPQGGIILYKKKFAKQIRQSIFPISQGGPLQSLLIAKLAAFEILDQIDLKSYASTIVDNAQFLSKELHRLGVPVTTGGTDTHILSVNLSYYENTDGAIMEKAMFDSKILVNKNLIPNDPGTPLHPSGIRLGVTPTTNIGYTAENYQLLAEALAGIIHQTKQASCDKIIRLLINSYSTVP